MPYSLAELEERRNTIARRIAELGDLRAGSISNTSGRCGKPNCRCHRPGQPGHGPNLRLTYKVDGKTLSESLSTPAAARKAEREVAEFRNFQQLSREFIETNAKICDLRPIEEESETEQKKNGRSDPSRGRARSRSTPAGHFPGSAQDWAFRSGSDGDGRTFRHAPGGRGRLDRTAGVPVTERRPTHGGLSLR